MANVVHFFKTLRGEYWRTRGDGPHVNGGETIGENSSTSDLLLLRRTLYKYLLLWAQVFPNHVVWEPDGMLLVVHLQKIGSVIR